MSSRISRICYQSARTLARYFSDANVDDDLLRYLVSALFTSRDTLFMSMAMGAMLTALGWQITREPVFGVYLVVHIVIGVARLRILRRFNQAVHRNWTREETLSFDRQFLAWSTLYAFTLGMGAYSLIAQSNVYSTAPLAVGACVGFTMGFVNRSSPRRRLFVLQMFASTLPFIVACLTLDVTNGSLYAMAIIGLVLSSLVLGRAANRKAIALYQANKQNERMARYDALTGLANRHAFSQSLTAALAADCGARFGCFAILMVDLDRFKEINDTLGHNVGDKVIVDTSLRLREAIGPNDILARLGGDEFIILAQNERDRVSFAADLADRIVETLSQALTHDSMPLPASASVGVAIYPDHGASAEDLMKKADIALYEAKHHGRNMFCVFDASMQSKINAARIFELDIQTAIQERQFEPWFQPIQDVRANRVIGYEALARWRHPRLGVLGPDRFIPIAEQSGAIFAISEQILERACLAAMDWPPDIAVSVNLSPVQFRRPQNLVTSVKTVLARTGLEPSRLFLEITETLLMEDTQKTRAAIKELADIGVRFSLDDFGVGYSSLSYIRHYPFSIIKIDKSFIANIDSDQTSSAVIAAISVLAERTGLEIVAEGVETLTQHSSLLNLGLRKAQGYLYGKPAPKPALPSSHVFEALSAMYP